MIEIWESISRRACRAKRRTDEQPGVVSGITMVFMPAVTTFAVSRLMSSGNIYLMGDMIEEYFITMNNRNVGSSMSLIMMVLILISMYFLRKADPEGKGGGMW